jgi:hypothetical protein
LSPTNTEDEKRGDVSTPTSIEPRTPLLNQVIAVRASVKNDTETGLTKHYHLLQKPALLNGQSRTYTPRDDDGFKYPAESTNVQVKAEQVLRNVAEELTKLFDVTAQMDWTNQHARADVVLLNTEQPVVLLTDVPVSYLMFLEKALINLETLVRRMPTLDPTENWHFDPATDTYKSDPVGTVKTAKVRRNHVLAAPTDRHPAQVESYTEDVPIGTWATVKFSGALPASRVNAMLARIQAVQLAVKFAREQANLEGVVDVHPGRRIFEFLFAPEIH